jgi:ubiquinone/menaquinone biosynthesis C-methylase UbiE
MKNNKNKKDSTSWEPVEKWYKSLVEDEGHYFHRQIILPGVMRLMEKPLSVLDIACGSGVLAPQLPSAIPYVGIDISASFIKAAKQNDKNKHHEYLIGDVTKPIKLDKQNFTHATLILAAQNLDEPKLAFQNVFKHLVKGGKFIIILNHPCFRIPRQSSWGVDSTKMIQYRRIDLYQSSMKIPIHAHPSKGDNSPSTLSFHYPLSSFVSWLFESGFTIELMEEWCSDKESIGKNAKMENRSRKEIPLFLAIRAIKNT